MSTKNEIANLAIAHLAIGKDVSDIDTDTTAEAKTLSKFYSVARQATLRDFNWPFALKITTLSQIGTSPTDDWGYNYTYPSDCLRLHKIRISGQRVDTRDTKIPYLIVYGTSGREIYTDYDDAEAEYTVDVTTEARFPEDFCLAFSYRLAMYIAPAVTAGDVGPIIQQIQQMYQFHLGLARQNSANEDGMDVVPDSEFIRIRG